MTIGGGPKASFATMAALAASDMPPLPAWLHTSSTFKCRPAMARLSRSSHFSATGFRAVGVPSAWRKGASMDMASNSSTRASRPGPVPSGVGGGAVAVESAASVSSTSAAPVTGDGFLRLRFTWEEHGTVA